MPSNFFRRLLIWVALLLLLINLGALFVVMVVDVVLTKVWAPAISFVCKLTGKSNFFFARLLSVIGMGALGIGYLLATVLDLAEAELGFAPFHLFFTIWFLSGVQKTWKFAKLLEGSDTIIQMTHDDARWVVVKRVVLAVFTAMAISAFLPITAGLTLVASASLYFLTQFHPKQKSKVRKAIEALGRQASRAKNIRLPAPVPSPS